MIKEVYVVLYERTIAYVGNYTRVCAVFSSMKAAEDYCKDNPLKDSIESIEEHRYFIENYDVED